MNKTAATQNYSYLPGNVGTYQLSAFPIGGRLLLTEISFSRNQYGPGSLQDHLDFSQQASVTF
jgi:hypothetical protein